MDFTSNCEIAVVPQPSRAICRTESQLKLKRKRADLASIEDVRSQRQNLARGPVTMSAIRAIQDAMYSRPSMSF